MLALGQLPPTLLLVPILFIVDNPQPIEPAIPWIVASGVIHIFYIFSLGAMYAQAGGNVSVVYPVARGSGVALAVFLADPLLGEKLTAQAYGGIALVIAGVVCMGFSSRSPTLYRRKPRVDDSLIPLDAPPDATVHPLDDVGAQLEAGEGMSEEPSEETREEPSRSPDATVPFEERMESVTISEADKPEEPPGTLEGKKGRGKREEGLSAIDALQSRQKKSRPVLPRLRLLF